MHFLEKTIREWVTMSGRATISAAMLGVTPDIARLAWPRPAKLIAVDQSEAMLSAVWPGNVSGERKAVLGDWTALPFPDRTRDIVFGDGSLNCLPYPHGVRAVAAEVARVLRPDGLFLPRCYVRPESTESPADLMSGLFDSDLPSFHHFKFRLLMAMQGDTRSGVAVKDVYRFWADWNVDIERLAHRTGWDQRSIAMMDSYRDADTVHTFPTLAELQSVLRDSFQEKCHWTSSARLGDRCPTLVLHCPL